MTETRIERDTMGEMILPADALYGAQTQRAVENFPISGEPMPAEFIHALGWSSSPRRGSTASWGCLTPDVAEAIEKARARSGRRRAGRRVPDRRLPDRLRHLVEHERQRGDRRCRLGRAGPAGPPQRPRQPRPVVERRDPDRAPRRRGAGDRARAAPGAPVPAGDARPQRRTSSTTWSRSAAPT